MFVVCFNCFLKDHLNTVMAEEDVFPPPKDRVSLSRSSFLILLFRQGKRKMCQDNNNTLKKALRFTNSLCCFLMSSKYVFETKIQTRHEDYRVSQQVLNTYAKCNVLKPRKVCEQSELRLQNIDPIKRGKF